MAKAQEIKPAAAKSPYGLVMYTDGSARPNHPTDGFMGCGIHSYIYIPENATVRKAVGGKNTVFTSKGYKPEETAVDKVYPYMVLDYSVSPGERGTNNKAELLAFIHGIEQIYFTFCKATQISISAIHHLTDSEYVKNGITKHLSSWVKRNWLDLNGVTIANVELWKKVNTLMTSLKEDGVEYTAEWVRGNDTVVGNMQADYLSVVGMSYSRLHSPTKDFINETQYTSGYWKKASDRHPLMNFRKMYFNTENVKTKRGLYFLSDPGDGDLYIGNRNSNTGFAVVQMNYPTEVLERVREFQADNVGGKNLICMLNVDRVYDEQVFKYITLYSKYALLKQGSVNNVLFVDNSLLSQELNPARLAPRALTYFGELENILSKMTSGEDKEIYIATDITDEFYDTDPKTALKKEFVVGYKDHHVKITRQMPDKQNELKDTVFNIPLQLGLDMPSRNNMKNLEGSEPKVYVVTYGTSYLSFKYCVYITCKDGSGVWANTFANIVIHKPK